MINERLEAALAWCLARNIKIGSDRINLFDRYYKSKKAKKDRNKAGTRQDCAGNES